MAFPDVQPDPPRRAPSGLGFGRLAGAYAIACLVATLLLPLALYLRDLLALGPTAASAHVDAGDIAAMIALGYPIIFVFAAPFSTALIVVTQALRRTPLKSHLAAGAVIGPLVGLIAEAMPALTPTAEPTPLGGFVVYALIGLASGAVFWYVAYGWGRPHG